MAEMEHNTFALQYFEYGEPSEVVDYVYKTKIFDLKDTEVLIKVLAAPINVADLITIRGKYSIKPPLPAVPGNECVGKILAIGPNVQKLQINDLVTPFKRGVGTWQSHLVLNEGELVKLPAEMGIAEAATINVNPCTAYRMLKDFVDLKPGDTVFQNGANSACGQIIIQLCRNWGVNCVCVVRDRPNIEQLRSYLMNLGAAHVMTAEELTQTLVFNQFSAPVLGINCVGGEIATNMLQHMANGSTFVTYGNMSGQPMQVSAPTFIYKDVRLKGYWMTRWTKENPNSPERFKMFEELIKLTMEGKLRVPEHELVDISTISFKHVFEQAAKAGGKVEKKYIMVFGH
ncbi:enoyl-[acyl-carrier-protein] reductase, mitochondrial-like [Culicoides brevitarsis]|uniref:enoyl-[acyl-carrier-protein] reductase, mitochondrial-like n=1 Tax=Culicoides brevitarsis TaxID=469753 RepID=UPI00307C0307